ncbi:MAG: hypothetical protein ACRC8S_19870 [Fimbriiglobus sp.]
MTRRTKCGLLGGLLTIIVMPIITFAWFWFSPVRAGEFRESPDDRYKAHAMNVTQSRLLGGEDHWIEIQVVEQATGRVIWQIVHPHPPEADFIPYYARDMKFIKWAADSSSVTIPIGNQPFVLAIR